MAFNIEYIIKAVDEFSTVGRNIQASMAGIAEKAEHVAKRFHHLERELKFSARVMTESFTAPLLAISGFAIKAFSDNEDLKESLIGSGVAAQNVGGIMQNLHGIANMGIGNGSIGTIGDAANSLLQAGVNTKDLSGLMNELGNAAAASGQKIGDIAAFYVKIKNQGKLTSADLGDLEKFHMIHDVMRGLTFNNKKLHMGNNKDMAFFKKALDQGAISAGALKTILEEMSKKGGSAADAMKNYANSLEGSFYGLKATALESLGSIGEELNKHFHFADLMNKAKADIAGFSDSFETFTKIHPRLMGLIMDFGGILAAIGPILFGMALFSGIVFVGMMTVKAITYPIRAFAEAMAFLETITKSVNIVLGIFTSEVVLSEGAVLLLLGAIGAAAYFLIKYRQQTYDFFAEINQAIIKFIESPFISIWNIIKKIIGLFGKLGGMIKSVFTDNKLNAQINTINTSQYIPAQMHQSYGYSPASFGSGQGVPLNFTNTFRHEIIMRVQGQPNTVKSIETKSQGNTAFIRGTNMPGAN